MANIRTIYNITTNTSVPGQCNNNNTQQKGSFTQTVDKWHFANELMLIILREKYVLVDLTNC